MSNYANRRFLAEYWLATDNEIAADIFFLRRTGQSVGTIGHIPRVPHWWTHLSSYPLLTLYLSRFLRLGWRLTAGVPFHILVAARLFLDMYRTRQDIHALPEEIGLAFSQRAQELVVEPQVPAPQAWIVPPWVEASPKRSELTHIPLLTQVTTADLINALWLAVIATSTPGRSEQRRSWLLQTYTALPWLLTRIALSRISANFVMAEHFDRWAVLADVVTRSKRRTGASHTQLTLVQHGYVGSLGADDHRIQLKYRLNAVSRLFTFDEASEQVFRTEILSPGAASRAATFRFKPTINLTQLAGSKVFRVLFVGHPMCAALQRSVFNGLAKENLSVFYKPHPVAGMPGMCEETGWHLILDRDVFPEVDLIVSYRSTLVAEYEGHGVAAIIHELSDDLNDVPLLIKRIEAFADMRHGSGLY